MVALNDADREQVAQIHHANRLSTAEIAADANLSEEGKAEAIRQSEEARQRDLDATLLPLLAITGSFRWFVTEPA